MLPLGLLPQGQENQRQHLCAAIACGRELHHFKPMLNIRPLLRAAERHPQHFPLQRLHPNRQPVILLIK